jgi:K+-sensing histidine kinase KdpD
VEEGVSTGSDGTGLGSTIGQEIAGAHGWEMEGTDVSETGARFEFDGVEWA